MTFTTLTFALFLAVVFALHWLARGVRGQNAVLVVASYVFYAWWDLRFAGLLLASSLLDYGVGRALARQASASRKRALLLVSLGANLGALGAFKYYGFFIEGLTTLAGSVGLELSPRTLSLILPVGISFYTFQTLGYTIDVYRGRTKPERDALVYLTYVSFFPQLVAGPIERAGRLIPQLAARRRFDEARARDGAKQMLWGFLKKVVLADHLGVFVEQVYGGPQVHGSGPALIVATIAFALQIYLDFSAYSDIAIGCSRLFGIDLMRNFATPYFSRTLGEFWRRWHISLSTWFQDYVYVPLGGSRSGPRRRWLAIMATFLLSGLWHGANATFVVWGAVNGLMLALVPGRTRRGPDDVAPSLRTAAGWKAALAMLATFSFICSTWVLFRAVDLAHAMGIYARIVSDLFRPRAWAELAYHAEFLAGFGPLIALLVLVEWRTRGRAHPLALGRWPRAARWALYTVLLWAALYLMPDSPTDFIYFQF